MVKADRKDNGTKRMQGVRPGYAFTNTDQARVAGVCWSRLRRRGHRELAQTSSPGPMVSAEATPAQDLLTDRFVINVGAFVLATDLSASLNGTASSPASGFSQDVDFNRTFGTSGDATRIRADVLWRFLPRHHLRFLYFDDDVKRTRSLDKDVLYGGDYTFKAAAQATAENKFTVYALAYEYLFMLEPTYEVAASAGVHYSEQTIRISGDATVTLADGTVQAASFQSKSSSLPAPLPVIGLRGGWAVAPHWFLDASAQFFKYRANPYDGHWWSLGVRATWMYNEPRRHRRGLGQVLVTRGHRQDELPGQNGFWLLRAAGFSDGGLLTAASCAITPIGNCSPRAMTRRVRKGSRFIN